MNTYQILLLTLFISLTAFINTNTIAANAPWVGQTFANAPCRGKSHNFGPFDYLTRGQRRHELSLVEGAHFPPMVYNLIKGHRGLLHDDIDYTLRAWPNHHRALNAISRYKLLFPNKPRPTSTVECYFQRAINFSPKDATTHMLYGMFLHKTKHVKAAEVQYEKAVELSPNHPVIRYNFGLLLFGQKKYSQAQQQAIIAYDANFPLNGLKNKLKRVKFWPPKTTPKPVETPNIAAPKQP
ncbi:MAG: hypothetical protein JKY11_05150 [Alphaproteobacteria bacterium]|nr:hypothetical protein [Alphaproteobacteria bacterium]